MKEALLSLLPLQSARLIFCISVASAGLLWAEFQSLPISWLPSSDSERFLWRIILTLVAFLIGLILLIVVFVRHINAQPRVGDALKEARARLLTASPVEGKEAQK